jgi:hypothetical protein
MGAGLAEVAGRLARGGLRIGGGPLRGGPGLVLCGGRVYVPILRGLRIVSMLGHVPTLAM